MLNHTFCHIPRISVAKERALWADGVLTWDDYRRTAAKSEPITASEHHLKELKPRFFADTLKSDQVWRLFSDFRATTAFIDIETTGLSKYESEITTIALYDGQTLKTYINGQNLEQFKDDIGDYKVIVTFNGKCFDVPFIEQYFGIKLDQAHIDLRYVMARLGFKGGLKAIERQLGIDRHELSAVDGFLAVALWQRFMRHRDESALETLLAYNCADVVNLELLMIYAFNSNLQATPFQYSLDIPPPQAVAVPFRVNAPLVQKLSWQ